MDGCVTKKGTAEVRWDVRHDLGEVCAWAGRSDELQTEKGQLRDWTRIGIDQVGTRTVGCDVGRE